MFPQTEPNGFRTSTASGRTTDDVAMELTHPRSRDTSNLDDRIDSIHSDYGLALLGPAHGLSPVNLQPKSVDDSFNTHRRRSGESSIDGKRYVCTFCLEMGESKDFGTKSDWKRHETNFHETGEEYRCNVDGCSEVFFRQGDFLKHLSKEHRDSKQCPSEVTTNIQLPPKYAYGCGFCRNPIYMKRTSTMVRIDFNERCDHVAQCMHHEDNWTFTKTILGLLKQPNVRTEWSEVRKYWCQRLKITRDDLEWHKKTSWTLRQRLECNDFGPEGLKAFLLEVFKLGLLDQNGRVRFSSAGENPASTAITPAPEESLLDNSMFPQDGQFNNTYSASDHLGGMSHIEQNSFHPMVGEASAYHKRQSIAMPDVPMEVPVHERYSATTTGPETDYTSSFSANVTPSLMMQPLPPAALSDNPVQDQSKASPGKRFLRHSKSWLSSKRPHHADPVNHPDLPLRYQTPNRNGGGGRSAHHRAAFEGAYAG